MNSCIKRLQTLVGGRTAVKSGFPMYFAVLGMLLHSLSICAASPSCSAVLRSEEKSSDVVETAESPIRGINTPFGLVLVREIDFTPLSTGWECLVLMFTNHGKFIIEGLSSTFFCSAAVSP